MKMLLYVADDFQQLQGGKTLAVGLFTDRVVVLNVPPEAPDPSPELPFGIPLGLLVCVLDLPRESIQAMAYVEPPNGLEVVSRQECKLVGVVGQSANIALRFQPFLIPAAGMYRVVIEADGERISESFEIRIMRVSLPQSPPTAPRAQGQAISG